MTENKQELSVVKSVVRATSSTEKYLLMNWAESLLAIRNSNLPAHKKAIEAIKLTQESKAIWPLAKVMSRELKRVGWDERSWKARLGFGAILGTLATVGNAGAGIAALGGAIGVPLWVVVGAGGAFAGSLVEELSKNIANPKSTYAVIDSHKEIPKK